jgi:hypothetical protein
VKVAVVMVHLQRFAVMTFRVPLSSYEHKVSRPDPDVQMGAAHGSHADAAMHNRRSN